MGTKLYINYARQARVPNAPVVKKIQMIKDRHLRITRVIGGVDVVTDYNFTNSGHTGDSQQSPRSYADTLYRYQIDETDLHVWIAGVVPANTPLPNPAYQESTYTAKVTVWKAAGEDNTIASPSGTQPDWIPGALSDANFIKMMKPSVIRCARNFDEGFRWHWLYHGTLGRDIFADPPGSGDIRLRFMHTNWWGRTWVGYVWRQLMKTGEGVGKNRITHEKMRTLIQHLDTELPEAEKVFMWFKSHDVADWSKQHSRTGKIGYKLHTTDWNTGQSETRIAQLSHPDWEEVLKTHYNAALHAD